ncbi:MAG: hypothetical protein GXO74_16505 [Calditrichaeota bacterium]|nr:hypothetical protein [Calditrichota bacterium]
MKLKILANTFVLSLLVIIIWSCFPEREPTKPDFEAPDVRRPAVAYHDPLSNAKNIPRDAKITIWFDELMNTASVEKNFRLWPKVSFDSLQTITIDKNNPQIIYVSRKTQGIFKSEDGGESWTWLTPLSMKMNLSQIIISPGNSNLLYAVSHDSGLYRSNDSGLNWEKIALPAENPLALAIDPTNGNVLFVATEKDGIYKSTDSGQNWEAKNDGVRVSRPPQDIAINPLNPQIIYLATKGDFILKSYNGGEKWTRIRKGFFTYYFNKIAVHPADTSRVFAVSDGGGIYRSHDSGDNWELIVEGLPNLDINAFAFDPQDTGRIIVNTGQGFYHSNDGGTSWTQSEQIPAGVNVVALAINPQNPEQLFAATNSGVFRSQQFAGVWEEKNNLPLDALYVNGTFQFDDWQDSTLVSGMLDATTLDTTIIFPYIYERALAAWYANGKKGDPPVDPNPKATKMTFSPEKLLLPSTGFQVKIIGTFEKDKETLRPSFGAADIHGNSFETDYNFIFKTGKQ